MNYNYKKSIMMLCFFATLKAFAYDYSAQIDGIFYEFQGDEAIVMYGNTTYNSYSGAIVIPETVSYESKTFIVTRINTYAFYNCDRLTSVVIPNSVTDISDRSFTGCI